MDVISSGTDLIAALQNWFSTHLHLPGWLLLPIVAVVCAALIDLILHFVMGRLERRLQHSRRRWDDPLVYGLRIPLRYWIWSTALLVSLGVIGNRLGVTGLTYYLFRGGALITLLLIGWSGIRLMRRLEQRLVFPPAAHHAKPVDATSASALTKIVGAIIITALALIGLQLMGVAMSSILAVGGFGGILVGFAARDVLANFFGGMVVHLDKPFVVGDWVRSPDRDIEGIVEDIGWRLTTIRTFAGPPLYIPNAAFSQIAVETPTRMISRRLWETVGIRYEDAHHIEPITRDIRQMLQDNDELDQQELITVNFTHYGQYSLDIMIYAFTVATDWQQFHEIQQNVLLKARDIIYRHGAELALPTARLLVPEAVSVREAPGADHERECLTHEHAQPHDGQSRVRRNEDNRMQGSPETGNQQQGDNDGDA